MTSKPNFDRFTIFDEDLIVVHMKKREVYFNKPKRDLIQAVSKRNVRLMSK